MIQITFLSKKTKFKWFVLFFFFPFKEQALESSRQAREKEWSNFIQVYKNTVLKHLLAFLWPVDELLRFQ